ncbi:unnamed protein product [Linum trigynum]|uniref:Uncharacterized protein n=1 Tax=Linum trigynum TaxID=586398 RepID=A0AAV2FXU3_9ROSI
MAGKQQQATKSRALSGNNRDGSEPDHPQPRLHTMEERIGSMEGQFNPLIGRVESLDQKVTDVTKLMAEGFAVAEARNEQRFAALEDLVRTIATQTIAAMDRRLEALDAKSRITAARPQPQLRRQPASKL